jgi:hypothetical protein
MSKHFLLTLRVTPGRDGVRELRRLLKIAGRHEAIQKATVSESRRRPR